MTGARGITQLCFSSNLAGIVANKIEQSFYSVYSYSGIELIEHALRKEIGRHGEREKISDPGGFRIHDLRNRSPLLYLR